MHFSLGSALQTLSGPPSLSPPWSEGAEAAAGGREDARDGAADAAAARAPRDNGAGQGGRGAHVICTTKRETERLCWLQPKDQGPLPSEGLG